RMFGRPFVAGQGLTHLFPAAAVLADADLARASVPRRVAESIQGLARAVRSHELVFERVADVRAFLARFRDVAGTDDWIAQYVARGAVGEPDAFPAENDDFTSRSESWRPWRAYAAMYLWNEHGHGAAETSDKRQRSRI